MALSDFTGPTYIDDWSADLDSRWPERRGVRERIVDSIDAWQASFRPTSAEADPLRLIELGVGNGQLAAAVIDRICHAAGKVIYTGVDINHELTQFALGRLGKQSASVEMVIADLNDSESLTDGSDVDVMFTLQTLHDLDGYTRPLPRSTTQVAGFYRRQDSCSTRTSSNPSRRMTPPIHVAFP